MKSNKYIFLICLCTLVLSSCVKEQYAYRDFDANGERVNELSLLFPSNTVLQLNSGTPDAAFTFAWTPTAGGLNSAATYRILFDRPGGDFSNPLMTKASSNAGAASRAEVTHRELQDAFSSAGLSEVIWTVEARVGEVKRLADIPATIRITFFGEGIADFSYTAPSDRMKLPLDKIRTPNEAVIFEWTATQSTSGNPVTYTWVADSSESFANPLIRRASDNGGASNRLSFTHAELVDLLAGVGNPTALYWRVEASSGGFTYSPATRLVWFEIFDVPNLYMLGDATSAGWDNNLEKPLQLDNKGGGLFEIITSLEGDKELKFILQRGSWDVNWGGPDLGGSPVVIGQAYPLVSSGPNIKVPESAVFKVTVNFSSGTFVLEKFGAPANLYLVGGSTSADWNPGNSVPFLPTGAGSFEVYAYMTVAGSGFKFLQVRDWAGDWGSKPGTRTKDGDNIVGEVVQEGEDNVEIDQDGFYRIEVDFASLSYVVRPMSWGIIGSATPTGWGDDTTMEFVGGKGSYTWTTDIQLSAGEIKFRANKSWDINFGDSGADGTLEYGGDNIAIGTAGQYRISIHLDPVNGYTYDVDPI